MSKYTIVDKETCIACSTCSSIIPEIFDHDEDGFSHVIIDDNQGTSEVPEEFYEDLEEAREECPTQSIKVSNYAFNGSPLNA